MAYNHNCGHMNCTIANKSVVQTLSEMDWEKGLWSAAFNNDIDRVKVLIDKAKDAKAIVNAPDNAGYTSLHYAARKGHIEVCKVLLQYGAFVDALTHSGKATPLHKAAVAGHIAAVKFLLESGACFDLQDADGETVLHKAVTSKNNDLVYYLQNQYPSLNQVKDLRGRIATEMFNRTK